MKTLYRCMNPDCGWEGSDEEREVEPDEPGLMITVVCPDCGLETTEEIEEIDPSV